MLHRNVPELDPLIPRLIQAKQKPLEFLQPPTNTILAFVPFSTHMSNEFVDNRSRSLDNESELVVASSSVVPVEPISKYLENDLTDIEPYLIPDKVSIKHCTLFAIYLTILPNRFC